MLFVAFYAPSPLIRGLSLGSLAVELCAFFLIRITSQNLRPWFLAAQLIYMLMATVVFYTLTIAR
jgi:hypothetical protein